MIKIYIIDNTRVLPRNDFLNHLNTLPVEMQNKASGFCRSEDAQAYLMGKILLKRALADLNLRSNLSDVKYTRYGRPYLENTFDFNISHSGRYVVCAISTYGRVGIDIEETKPVLVHEFRGQFVDEEWESIINTVNSYKMFYTYWTAKEAVIKADGKGLSIPLRDVCLKGGRAVVGEKTWFYKEIYIDHHYHMHIASDWLLSDLQLIQLKWPIIIS